VRVNSKVRPMEAANADVDDARHQLRPIVRRHRNAPASDLPQAIIGQPDFGWSTHQPHLNTDKTTGQEWLSAC
jgi:hypothetical protein